MGNQEVYIFNSSDGHSVIHCRKWIPEGQPVAVLQLVHGMVEYIERYDEFATFLASKGYLVVGHDHIGHGHSVQSDDELGVMTGKHPSDFMVEDAIYQYEPITGIHVFPILNPPPSSLPIPSLWVVPVHQPQASSIVHRTWTGNSFHT